MIADEIPPHRQQDPPEQHFEAANDDGARKVEIDLRLLTIARAIGRQIAREELGSLKAANDNNLEDAP